MNQFDKTLKTFLKSLDLDEEQANIYLTLAKQGILSPLELSRSTGINRTRIYRTIEDMEKQGIVEEVVRERGKRVQAADPSALKRLMTKKESKVKKLKSLFPNVEALLSTTYDNHDPLTKVLFYRGKEGIKQMIWNTLRAKGTVYGYSIIDLDNILGKKMAEEWRIEVVKREIIFRDITSNKEVLNYPYVSNIPGYYNQCPTRYISPEKLTIDQQIDIYNDVMAFYTWENDEMYGVELYNKGMANLQKQIFDILWESIGSDLDFVISKV